MNMKQILPWVLVAVVGIAGYFFKDKLFSGGSVTTSPTSLLPVLKSNVTIDSASNGRVVFTVNLEATKDCDITSLRAYYYDKKMKREKEYGVGNRSRSRSRLNSREMGNFDMSEGKITLKAGEKQSLSGYFVLENISDSHYIEITGIADAPCPPDMDIMKCIEQQMANMEKDSKTREIYLLEKVIKDKK
jgi:hypothetical protein